MAPTALRESRAHSSTMRTLGLGRARHSSARTLTTDRAPLSRPPPTSVESDPRLNWLWAQVSSLRAFIIANCVEPGNDIGLNTSWAPTATELPMLFFTKATEMDLLVSCMGSGQQLLHYASVITGYGLRTRSHRHRHRTTSTAYFTFALLGPLLVDHLLAHRQHLSPAASRPLPGSSSASVSGGQPDRRALSLRSSASSSGRAFIQTPVIRLARAPQPMCGAH